MRAIIFYTLFYHHTHRKHGRPSGDGPAVAAEAVAPQNLGEPGECGSAADFFSGCLISGCFGFRAMGDWPAVEAKAAAPQIGLRAMGAGNDTMNATTAVRHRCDEGDDPTTETTASRHRGDNGNDPTTATTVARHRGNEGDDPTTAMTAYRR